MFCGISKSSRFYKFTANGKKSKLPVAEFHCNEGRPLDGVSRIWRAGLVRAASCLVRC